MTFCSGQSVRHKADTGQDTNSDSDDPALEHSVLSKVFLVLRVILALLFYFSFGFIHSEMCFLFGITPADATSGKISAKCMSAI